jgi:predicted nuclease with TOPRIM domain
MSMMRSAAKSVALRIPPVRRVYHALLAAYAHSAVLEQKLAALTAENGNLGNQLAALEHKMTALNCESANVRNEVAARNSENASLRGELDARNSQSASLRAEFDTRNSENANLRNEFDTRNAENASLRNELGARNDENAKLRGELDVRNSENANLRNDLAARGTESANLRSELDARNAESVNLRSALAIRDSENENLRTEVAELERTDRAIHNMLVARNAENAYLQSELVATKGQKSNGLLPGFEWHQRGFDWSRESAPVGYWADPVAKARTARLQGQAAAAAAKNGKAVAKASEGYEFSEDYLSPHLRNWEIVFRECVNDAKKVLEIGSYEGRSAVWLVEHAFKPDHGGERYCVDTWFGSIEHDKAQMPKVEKRFDRNIAKARRGLAKVKVHKVKGNSTASLMKLLAGGHGGSFDFIYVDGSHQPSDVLSDLVLSRELCRVGGIIACDDYLWGNPLHGPKIAIDAFANCFFGKVEPIPGLQLYQLYFRKLAG